MTNTDERSDGCWANVLNSELGPLLSSDLALEDPRDFVKLVAKVTCGANGKFIYVVNQHNNQRITVTVRTRWTYQDQPCSQTNTYLLEPGQESEVGCTIPGPTAQFFYRDITGARFS